MLAVDDDSFLINADKPSVLYEVVEASAFIVVGDASLVREVDDGT